jgi:hypothetical protein
MMATRLVRRLRGCWLEEEAAGEGNRERTERIAMRMEKRRSERKDAIESVADRGRGRKLLAGVKLLTESIASWGTSSWSSARS